MSNVFLFFHVFSASIFSCMFFSLGQLFIPQQRKLMGSSAQNSSGVDWCRGGSGSTRFRRQFRRFPRGFRRRSRRRLRRSLGAKPSQAQQGSREGSGEGSGGFGAEPGQVQHDSGKFRRSGRLWCKARSGSTFFGTFSETLLNLTWLCTKASQAFSGTHWTWLGFAPKLLRNLLRSVEPDLALHQSLPDLLRESSGWPGHWLLLAASPEPSPEPCWTWPGSAPKPPGTFSGTWLALRQDLLWNLLRDLLREPPRPSPEPSPEPCWTWPNFPPKPPGTFSGTFFGTLLNLTRLCTKASQTFSEPSPEPSPEPWWT